MLHHNFRTALDHAAELIGLVVFIAVCRGVYSLLAGLAAHIRPVLS